MRDDGSVTGQWHDNLGKPPFPLHARVICLNVQGNEAWVVGEVTHPKPIRGWLIAGGLRDLGVSANDPPDQVTFIFVVQERDFCLDPPEDWEWYDYSRGQVSID